MRIMHRTKKRPRKTTRRRLVHEPLETRRLLSADADVFFGFGGTSVSFPVDGTQIGFRQNELNQSFDARFPGVDWKAEILRALQTWAREADINVGVVDDDGSPAGVYGPVRGDERFGDIRIFGVGLDTATWAEAVSEQARTAGTWAGDIIFNTNAPWSSIDDLKTAALHEVGHIFGLEHSTDPNSPMHQHGPSANAQLTANDIALLQALHGPRRPDPTEGDHGNDTFGTAAEIEGSDDDHSNLEGFDGSQVWLQFASLFNQQDVDVFEIEINPTYSGPLAVEVATRGVSLARLEYEVLDRNGVVLGSQTVNDPSGGTGRVDIDIASGTERVFVRVRAGADEFWTAGDYAVRIGTPQRLTQEAPAIAEYTRRAHRWYFDSEQAKDGFSYHLADLGLDGTHDDDGHSDDDGVNARALLPAVDTPQRRAYSTIGSLSDLADVDYLKFTTPASVSAGTQIVVSVESLNLGGIIPEIVITDRDGIPVESRVVLQGYGTIQITMASFTPDTDYLIRLSAPAVATQFRTGDFSLLIDITATAPEVETFLTGMLKPDTPTVENTLYVARTQIFAFSLTSSANSPADALTQVLMRLYDADGNTVKSINAPLGELRSVPGVLLEPGEYYLQVTVVTEAATIPDIQFEVNGTRPSQPIGPLVESTDALPIYDCGVGGDFCYPDGTTTTTPVHIGPPPPPAAPVPPPPTQPLPPPPDGFFWLNERLPTNPINRQDTSGDGILSPLDALIVINYLNRNGSGAYPPDFVGYIDVNADSFITPLDALSVINVLNR
ncbi:MAG: hypothetical protein D6753_01585 [Planctomycetota bacterium]|nr:MAG: hypothetical protein D6753_01585 [Planctomycetota bacterium]